MGRIQTLPVGYLDALGLKTTGRNPTDAAETVSPILEMSPYYFADNLGTAGDSVVTADPFAGAPSITIPNGEAWIVLSASFGIFRNGVTFNVRSWSIGVQILNNFVRLANQTFRDVIGGIGQNVQCVYTPPFPIVFPAGTQFLGSYEQGDIVSVVQELDILFVRLNV